MSSAWTHTILENFCMYSSMSKKYWKSYGFNMKTMRAKGKPTITLNKGYIPKSERPMWCKNNNKKLIPNFRCLCSGKNDVKCPFFAMCNAEKKDYKIFNKAWNESVKEEK